MKTIKINQKVAITKNNDEYSTGKVTKIKHYKALIRFDNKYSRWCNIDNLCEISDKKN